MTPTASGLNAASHLGHLLAAPMRPGTVMWIGLRPGRRQPLIVVPDADLDPEHGLLGDHYQGHTNRTRQVTLIQAEHIATVAACLGTGPILPERLRRNIVVSGINLHALKGQQFQLGSAILVATGECQPCSRMEEALGTGGYNAVRGHGGITARIIQAGHVSVGDAVTRLNEATDLTVPTA